MTHVIILILVLIPPPKHTPVKVDGICFNTIYDKEDDIIFKQVVFMDDMGNSLGFYSIYEDDDGVSSLHHSVINKMVFLRNCKHVVKYRHLFPEKHTTFDYEVSIRNKKVERILP